MLCKYGYGVSPVCVLLFWSINIFYCHISHTYTNTHSIYTKQIEKTTLVYNINNYLCKVSYFTFRIINLPYIGWITHTIHRFYRQIVFRSINTNELCVVLYNTQK